MQESNIVRLRSFKMKHVSDEVAALVRAQHQLVLENLVTNELGRSDKKQKIILFPMNQDIKLHESKNAWRPSFKAKDIPDERGALDVTKLKKKVCGILNKLTPENLDLLAAQIRDALCIDTEEKLKVVVNLIFEKAINEPKFSVQFANLCKSLALIRVPQEESGRMVQFRKLLLTKCEHEFKKYRNNGLLIKIKNATVTADGMELGEHEKKIRMRQLGSIRFIGELFKLGMLIEPIMHECINELLLQRDEVSLEYAALLLKTIGKELQEKQSINPRYSPNLMDQYISQMQMIVDRRMTSTRIRCLLQDVIDLKKVNWIPRRDENNPKTIDQIHKEAEREARKAQQVYQPAFYSKRRVTNNERKLLGRNMGVSEHRGTALPPKRNEDSSNMADPSKLKLTELQDIKQQDLIRVGETVGFSTKTQSNRFHFYVDSFMLLMALLGFMKFNEILLSFLSFFHTN